MNNEQTADHRVVLFTNAFKRAASVTSLPFGMEVDITDFVAIVTHSIMGVTVGKISFPFNGGEGFYLTPVSSTPESLVVACFNQIELALKFLAEECVYTPDAQWANSFRALRPSGPSEDDGTPGECTCGKKGCASNKPSKEEEIQSVQDNFHALMETVEAERAEIKERLEGLSMIEVAGKQALIECIDEIKAR